MIITCASCLTKFSLEDSRLPVRGGKVRCSRCHHVFYVVPPSEAHSLPSKDAGVLSDDDIAFTAGPQSQELSTAEPAAPPLAMTTTADETYETEVSIPEPERPASPAPLRREKPEVQTFKPKRALPAQKSTRSAPVIALVVLVIILVVAFFCFWTGYGVTLYSYVQEPVKKIADLWNQFWGIENGMRYFWLGC